MGKSFVEWFTEKADRLGWSDAELARQVGVEQSTISNIRNGSKRPGWKTIQGMAKAFGCEVDEILEAIEGKRPEDLSMAEWERAGRQLSAEERAEILEWAWAKIARRNNK